MTIELVQAIGYSFLGLLGVSHVVNRHNSNEQRCERKLALNKISFETKEEK